MSVPRRRRSGRPSAAVAALAPVKTEDYAVRWQPITNTATPSIDIMSSPDPLNETVDDSAFFPSSAVRRVTRSQRSSRYTGSRAGSRSASPRKQTFELEVGNDSAPQKLLVTVETDEAVPSSTSTRRRLFQSPGSVASTRRQQRTTTTTIPLRDEDEVATPKKRGRPRKSNGTPIPGAGVKRRAGTPMKRTPRKPRIADLSDTDDALSELSMQPTPQSTRRGRPPKSKSLEPQSDGMGVPSSVATTSTRRGGRRRRQAMDQEELIQMADLATVGAIIHGEDGPSDDSMDLVAGPQSSAVKQSIEQAPPTPGATAPDSDVWLNPLEDETPRPRQTRASKSKSRSVVSPVRRTTRSVSAASSTARKTPTQATVTASEALKHTSEHESEAVHKHDVEDRLPEIDAVENDFGDLGPAPSDVSSADDVDDNEPTPHRSDTIANGEDFSMIFMDSLPSLQASFRQSNNSTAAPPLFEEEEHEIGDETEAIINTTLENLKQSLRQESEAEAEADDVDMFDFDEPEVEPSQREPMSPEKESEPRTSQRALSQDEPEAGREVSEPPEIFEEDAAQSSSPSLDDEEQPDLDDRALSPDLGQQPGFGEEEINASLLKSPSQSDVAGADDLPQSSPFRVQPVPEEEPQPTPRANLSPIKALSPSLARSPRRMPSPLRHQVLKHSAMMADRVEFTEGSNERRLLSQAPLRPAESDAAIEDSNMYEDSFSEIPEVVLAAATPRKSAAIAPAAEIENDSHGDNESQEDSEQEMEDALEDGDDLLVAATRNHLVPQINIEMVPETTLTWPATNSAARSDTSAVSQPEHGRLPTPDDTPPHADGDTSEDEAVEKSAQTSRASADHSSPVSRSYQEEIEIVQKTASHRAVSQQPTLSIEQPTLAPKVTPVNQFSSPLQETQSLMPEIRSARPTLSPIVRAGRVLQSVTSDPPSPETRERQLGSPFRSSASKDSRDSQVGRRVSMSPPRPFNFPAPRSSSVGAAPAAEDPFQSTSNSITRTSFLQALGRSLEGGSGHRRTISQESITSSTRHAPPSEAMSWVANEGPISPRLRGDMTLKEVAESSMAGGTDKGSVVAAQTEAEEDQEVEDEVEEQQDMEVEGSVGSPIGPRADDTDIWEFEASRITPRSTRQQPFGRKAPAPILKRGTLPSPWVKPGQTKTAALPPREASPELHTSDHDKSPAQLDSEPDEFSMLAEQRQVEEEKARQNQSPSRASRFDLSSFFSSPAALPGMIAAKTMQMLGSRAPVETPIVAVPAQVQEVPLQMEEVSAPAKLQPLRAAPLPRKPQDAVQGSPVKPGRAVEPTLAQEPPPSIVPPQPLYPQITRKAFQPGASPRRDLFSSPSHSATKEKTPEITATRSGSPAMSEQVPRSTRSPQKAFTPRQRQASQTFLQPSSVATTAPPSAARTPPRMQLSHDDIANWRQQTTTVASEDSPDFRRPLLRPLPGKNASPTKSSLRSPMKPHTPGRVVDFTSSVLSPLEQAQQRSQARGSVFTPGLFSQPTSQQGTLDDKENQQQETSDVSMTDASPITNKSASSTPEPLSQTAWSRQHWLLLDELLQLRRQGPFVGDYNGSDNGAGSRSARLLGKTVRSQGEAMRLEQWHLDCVDAFVEEVGGWDESVLAKRVFALVLGEARRARGLVEKDTRVMFH